MELFVAVLLGVVQGILEWLPVSSEGVITLAMTQLFGEGVFKSVNVAVWLHLGTMLSALVYFRQDFIELVHELPRYLSDIREKELFGGEILGTTSFLVIGTLITAVVGGLLYIFGIKELAARPRLFTGLMGLALLVTGLLRLYGSKASKAISDLNIKDTAFVGLFQGLSIVPGVSRSGSTVFALFYRNFSGKDAFHLSFLLSVPAVLIANIGIQIFTGFDFSLNLVIAAGISFIVGYLMIGLLLKLAGKMEVTYLCFLLAFLAFISILV